jgi:hydrogenase nickel incorporation protein HypA/HybF
MHELRIAGDLSEIVLETASTEGLSVVTNVNVTFGVLVQIVPEIFESAFREVVRNTAAENAVLNFEIVPIRLDCRNCRNIFTPGENMFTCPICGSNETDIISGKELFITSIEGE